MRTSIPTSSDGIYGASTPKRLSVGSNHGMSDGPMSPTPVGQSAPAVTHSATSRSETSTWSSGTVRLPTGFDREGCTY